MVSNFDLNRTALNNQMMGLSTDAKPTTGILPNSLFWELDTNGMYYFDGTQWQSIGGSGGGGGSGAVSTASVTFNMVNYDADIMGMFNPVGESYSAFYTDDGVTNSVTIEEASKTVTIILDANGTAMVGGDYDNIISLSGDAEFDDPETKSFVVITGDCTINFNGIWNG